MQSIRTAQSTQPEGPLLVLLLLAPPSTSESVAHGSALRILPGCARAGGARAPAGALPRPRPRPLATPAAAPRLAAPRALLLTPAFFLRTAPALPAALPPAARPRLPRLLPRLLPPAAPPAAPAALAVSPAQVHTLSSSPSSPNSKPCCCCCCSSAPASPSAGAACTRLLNKCSTRAEGALLAALPLLTVPGPARAQGAQAGSSS
jgi:hypothetical protein